MSAAAHEQDPRRVWQGLEPQPDNIPSDIKAVDQWVLWVARFDKAKNRTDKVPKQLNGRPASVTDPSTWTDYQTALASLQEQDEGGPFAGLGFVLTERDDFGALDFDHVRNAITGEIDPQVNAVVGALGTYAEVSPSGTGIRVLFRGKLPDGPLSSPVLQAWSAGRFVTLTGHHLPGTPPEIRSIGADALSQIAATFAPKPPPAEPAPAAKVPPKTIKELRSALASIRADDRELWIRIGLALRQLGDAGRGLWLEWSQTSEKYDPKDAARVWDSFKPNATDHRAVFAEAQRNGWVNPQAGTAREQPPHPATDRTAPPADDIGTGTDRREPYALDGGVFKLIRQIQKRSSSAEGGGDINSEVLIPLANFSAIVIEERRVDDGAEVDHRSIIRATLPRPTGPLVQDIDVPTDKFSSLAWVTTKLGHQYIVNAGTATRDHLRCCIQRFSDAIQVRDVYAHTGWRQIEGRWLYLHAGGAIGADGLDTSLSIELPEQLNNYNLPAPPPVDEARAAVRASLEQMILVDDGMGAVQLARIYAPPLCEWYRFDLGVFVTGRTGTHKSELAALAMAHYGQGFNARTLPGGWESTEGALLLLAFRAKNALFEIDDFNPIGGVADHQAMSRKADRLYRGQANGNGKDRLTPDIRLRASHTPRGVVSSSGEDLPTGRSLRARMWLCDLEPGQVDLDTLSRCQEHARRGTFAASLSAYLQWTAARVDTLRAHIPARYEQLRTEAPPQLRDHPRIGANWAALVLAVETFLNFATSIGAVDETERDALFSRFWNALTVQGVAQMDVQEQSEDATRFVDMLRSALSTGKAFVADGDERDITRAPPTHAAQLGWRGTAKSSATLPEHGDSIRWEPLGDRIGYAVGAELWLDPDAAMTAVSKISTAQGQGALRSQIRLGKALAEKGYLIRRTGDRHITYRHGRSWLSPSRVWRMGLDTLLIGANPPAPPDGAGRGAATR